jgi:hypothetical protein
MAETDTLEAASQSRSRHWPYFAYVPQHKDWTHISQIPRDFWANEYESPCLGRASYIVLQDGSLKLVEHNWDTHGS